MGRLRLISRSVKKYGLGDDIIVSSPDDLPTAIFNSSYLQQPTNTNNNFNLNDQIRLKRLYDLRIIDKQRKKYNVPNGYPTQYEFDRMQPYDMFNNYPEKYLEYYDAHPEIRRWKTRQQILDLIKLKNQNQQVAINQ